jgi:hypothetical protein
MKEMRPVMKVRKVELIERLDAIGAGYSEIALAPGVDLVVSSFGGRVFGPFIDGVDAAGWASPAFATNSQLVDFAGSGDWNIGGERLWLSPELDFLVGDRTRFWETFSVPGVLDPGTHRLTGSASSAVIKQRIDIPGRGRIAVSRDFTILSPEALPQADGIRTAGYRQAIEIISAGPSRPAVPWIVRQIAPGGTVLVPVDAGGDAIAMLGEPPAALMRENAGAIRIDVRADTMFKIAVPALTSAGLIGHLYPIGEKALLQVFRFSRDRQGTYHDEPPDRPGLNGFSTFVFQDDGSLGSYGEIEMVGLDLGPGSDGRRQARLDIYTIVAIGDTAAIDHLVADMLHVPARL